MENYEVKKLNFQKMKKNIFFLIIWTKLFNIKLSEGEKIGF